MIYLIISLKGVAYTSLTHHLKSMYQARKVSGLICLCFNVSFYIFLRFFYWILEMFRQYGIFVASHFVITFKY